MFFSRDEGAPYSRCALLLATSLVFEVGAAPPCAAARANGGELQEGGGTSLETLGDVASSGKRPMRPPAATRPYRASTGTGGGFAGCCEATHQERQVHLQVKPFKQERDAEQGGGAQLLNMMAMRVRQTGTLRWQPGGATSTLGHGMRGCKCAAQQACPSRSSWAY